ncbi:hypothetical protein [Hungatella sp.]|uniref:hypothetical protein n=1 Tax=Hungatella sp. TaxID=2613924 RepID=UPI0039939AFA
MPEKLVPEGTFEVWNGLGHAGEGNLPLLITYSHSGVSRIRQPVLYRIICQSTSILNGILQKSQIRHRLEMRPRQQQRKANSMNDCLVEAVVKDIEELDKNGWNYNTSRCTTKLKK